MTPAKPLTLYLISACILFVALGALPAGAQLILDPSGVPLGWTTEMLSASPFTNYLIPGLVLFGVNGIGSLIVVYALWARPRSGLLTRFTQWTREQWPWAAALALGLFLIAWIMLQLLWTQTYSPFQPMIGGIGLAIILLDVLPATRRYYRAETAA